jgi:hypothetical protein
MGLNVCVFSSLTRANDQDPDNFDFETQFYAHPASVEDAEKYFPGRSEGVEIDVVYDFGTKHELDFGYGEYNDWRDALSSLAQSLPRSDAFHELIEFPDNEGVIGPVVSRKLAGDFAEFENRAKTKSPDFVRTYLQWKKAFETAANSGAVQFQ